MGAGAVADGLPRRPWPTAAGVGVDYEGEYRVDWTNNLGERRRAPDHPLDVRLRRPARGDRPRDRRHRRVVAVHDVGRAVNPLLCEGQIEGSVHMGLGYALTEDFPADAETGFPTNMTLRSLGILRAKDVPPDRGDPGRVARSPTRPTASRASARSAWCRRRRRVAAALHDLDGEWRAVAADAAPARRRRGLSDGDDAGLVCGHHHLYSALARGMPAAAGGPTRLPGDPGAGLVAARRRPRPRDAALVGHARRPRGARVRHHRASSTTTRSPNAIEGSLDVIADACAEVGVRVVVRLRRDRPLTRPCDGGRRRPDDGPARPGRERALPARRRARAWSASTPRSPAATRRWRRRPGWPPTSASASTSTWPRADRRRRRRAAGTRWPPTTGCSSTASTSTATLPGTIAHNPRSQHEQRASATPGPRPGPTRSCSAPTASAPTCSRSSAWPTSAYASDDVLASPDTAVVVAGGRPAVRPRGGRRPRHLELRPRRLAVARGLHARHPRHRGRRRRRRGAAATTASRRGSTSTRSGPRPPSRPSASSPPMSPDTKDAP